MKKWNVKRYGFAVYLFVIFQVSGIARHASSLDFESDLCAFSNSPVTDIGEWLDGLEITPPVLGPIEWPEFACLGGGEVPCLTCSEPTIQQRISVVDERIRIVSRVRFHLERVKALALSAGGLAHQGTLN